MKEGKVNKKRKEEAEYKMEEAFFTKGWGQIQMQNEKTKENWYERRGKRLIIMSHKQNQE